MKNLITLNSTEKCGGGIYCKNSSDAVIKNNIITKNHAALGGGGMACRKSRPEIFNNVFTENTADSMAGGLHFEKEGNALVCNSIIRGNGKGPGFEISLDDGSPIIKYCVVPEKIQGTGNIDTDPYFRNPGNGDYRLMSVSCGYPFESPCIDTGDPAIIDVNLDCDNGLGTGRGDMGAFGGT